MRNLKIGVVGFGYWGKNHITTLERLNALNGIVEINKTILESVLRMYPNVKGYTNLSDALIDDYDGFIIASIFGRPKNLQCWLERLKNWDLNRQNTVFASGVARRLWEAPREA